MKSKALSAALLVVFLAGASCAGFVYYRWLFREIDDQFISHGTTTNMAIDAVAKTGPGWSLSSSTYGTRKSHTHRFTRAGQIRYVHVNRDANDEWQVIVGRPLENDAP